MSGDQTSVNGSTPSAIKIVKAAPETSTRIGGRGHVSGCLVLH